MRTTTNLNVFDLTSTVHEMSSIDMPRYNTCLQDDSSEMMRSLLLPVESDISLEPRTLDDIDQIESQVSHTNANSHPCLTSTPQSNQPQDVLYQSSGLDLGSSIDFTELTETDELLSQIPPSGSATNSVNTSETPNTKGLLVMYTNIDTYLNKREEFQTQIADMKPDIICLVEILPKTPGIIFHQCEYTIQGYYSYFNNTKKRGIAIFVNNNLVSSLNEYLSSDEFDESLWLKIQLKGRDTLLLGCIYRSPNSDDLNNNRLIQLLKKVSEQHTSHLLIVGDFNCKDINWDALSTVATETSIQSRLLDVTCAQGWTQHVKTETRFRMGQKSSLLDLVITNESGMVENLQILSPIGKSDHGLIFFGFVCYHETKITKSIPKYYLGDYDGMRNHLFQRLNKANLMDDTDKDWEYIRDCIIDSCNKFIPKSKPGTKKRQSWVDKNVITSVRLKRRAWNRFRKNKSDENWHNYTKARNYATWETKQAKRAYEKSIAKNIKANPKCFWNMVREKTKVKQGISDLVTDKGDTITDDTEKASLLNAFFATVFTKEDTINIPSLPERPFQNILDNVVINQERVKKLLDKLKIDKSPGPDGIHNRVLYETREVILEPLTKLLITSIESGKLPDDWKTANVTPIFKKGKKSDPNNYRPVSLTSTVCKLMETIIRDEIVKHVENQKLLNPAQHGFRSNRSCSTQLIEVIHDWANSLDENTPVDSIYLDYRKAFDSVPFERLLVKLHAYGIRGKIHRWIRDQSIQIEKTSTRGHKFKIFKPRCKTNVKKNTLAYRAVNEWNALSNDVIEAENINQFKSKLEEYWHDKEYKYDPSGFHDY